MIWAAVINSSHSLVRCQYVEKYFIFKRTPSLLRVT